MRKPHLFRQRPPGGVVRGTPQRFGRHFTTRLRSADHGLLIEARFVYDWQPLDPPGGVILHGDAVARSMLTDLAAASAAVYPVLLADTAEAAINRELSHEIRTDPRLSVSGLVTLAVSEDTLLAATRRTVAAEHEHVREASRTTRLEALRRLLLDEKLGLVWWIDRYADLQFAAGDPSAKIASVITAFQLATDALRIDVAGNQPDDRTVVRARFEEILAVLDDPQTTRRAADLLEHILRTFAPQTSR
ncbi:hypothetical protein PUR28_37525 [Streptomyces sp. BE308]|uniref:hypothetical protein n=1 Tax=unclassified Streptomyces TaxID=2593676 RepID=UPI002E76985B|nr:hypothetical protein [Streptomyces sp. BE308]MEE1796420.1 hypothetical protein [Streptomyces sp. BE308]